MRTYKTVLSLILLLAGTNMALAQSADDAAKRGERAFMAYHCYACHGTQGNGGPAAYPKLAPNPIPVEAIRAELRTTNAMPRYTESMVTDAEIADIHAYLASIPQGPKAADIPALNR